MPTVQFAAWIATIGFAGLAAFQLALALGAPLGHLAWGGTHRRLPARLRLGSLLSVGIFAFGAVCVLERAGVIRVLGWPSGVRIVVWVLTALFALSALGNLASRSTAERRAMTPVALVLTAACLAVALAP